MAGPTPEKTRLALYVGGGALGLIALASLGFLALNSGSANGSSPEVAVAALDKKGGEAAPNVKEEVEAARKDKAPSDVEVMTKTAESKNSGEPAMNVAKVKDGISIDAIALGEADAPVTLIEYGSLTCGHCRRFHEETLPKLKADYLDTGKVRWVFRPFALNGVDVYAGLLVACLPAERRAAMVDRLYKDHKAWIPYEAEQSDILAKLMSNLKSVARPAGLTDASVDQCMENEANKRWLQEIMDAAAKHKVNSTPTFIIDGKAHSNMGWEDMRREIEKALKKAE